MSSYLQLPRSVQSVLPPGVLSVLNGDDSLGPLVAGHQGIDKVHLFTPLVQTTPYSLHLGARLPSQDRLPQANV